MEEEIWKVEDVKGYVESTLDETVNSPKVIVRDGNTFPTDKQAAKGARKKGVKVLFLPQTYKWSPLCYYGIIATRENLQNTVRYIQNNSWTFNGKAERLAEQFKGRVEKQLGMKL